MSILFLKLHKVDATQRIVTGVAVSEVPDKAGEIFDYQTSKPEFEKWSENARKISGDKSLGNVRGMHSPIAIGKLISLDFNDRDRAIHVEAKIVNDNEWKKVEEGVYTGFSIGGKYLKRWQDGDLKRYTAEPSEISLVDLPAVPSATFTLVKRDGSSELREFRQRNDDLLLKAASVAQTHRFFERSRTIDGSSSISEREMVKRSMIGDQRQRLVIGDVETKTGHVHVEHDQDADVVHLNDAQVSLSAIDRDLARSFEASAAYFRQAQDEREQVSARTLVGLVVQAIVDRHHDLVGAKVQEQHHRIRYD